jgi:parallel beta-helix repeat protein
MFKIKFLILVLILSMGALGACDPPTVWAADTDWTINSNEDCANSSAQVTQINVTGHVHVMGNLSLYSLTMFVNKSLNITGNFTCSNCTLRMNGTTDGASNITVFNNARFNSTNSSIVTNGDVATAEYDWYFLDGSSGLINDTEISEVNTNGIRISDSNGNVAFENNTFSNFVGLCLNLQSGSSGIRIFNNSFDGCTRAVYSTDASNLNIGNNTITATINYPSWLRSTTDSWIYNNTLLNNLGLSAIRVDKNPLSAIYSNYINVTENVIISNTDFGITISDTNNTIIDNNTVNLGSANTGIYIINGLNSTISENVISNTQEGITIVNVDTSEILNNSITNSTSQGIEVYGGSENNIIANNTITISPYGGIYFYDTGGSPNNNLVTNNTIYNTTEGIYLESSTNTRLTLNNVTLNNMSGINLNQSTGTIIDSNIIQNNSAGIMFSWYSSFSGTEINNILANNTLTANNITFAFNNSNTTMFNTTMPYAINYNISAGIRSNVIFENVTHSAVNVTDTSFFNSTWYMDVTVLDGDSLSVISGATVTATDTNGVTRMTSSTGASGMIATEIVSEYEERSTGRTTFSPYNVTGSYSGFTDKTNTTTFTSSDHVFVMLDRPAGGGGGGGLPPKPPDEDEEVDLESCMEENGISSLTEDKNEDGIPDWVPACGVYNSPKAGGGGGGFNRAGYYLEGIQIIPDKLWWENIGAGTFADPITVKVIFKGEHTIDFKSDTFWAVLPEGKSFEDNVEFEFNCDASWLQEGEYFDVIEVYADGVLAAELPMACGVEGGINIWWKLGISMEFALGLLLLIFIAWLYFFAKRRDKKKRRFR